jgi:hypothetical protein
MLRFLKNASAFCAIQLAIFVVLAMRQPTPSKRIFGASIDKHHNAQQEIGRRVFLVGGSNVAFGFESPAIQEALRRRPVNFGLHACLGLDYMLSEVSSEMHTGDVVVLIPEYDHFAGDIAGIELFEMLEANPAAAQYIDWSHRMKMLDLGLVYLRRVCLKGMGSLRDKELYRRTSYNEFGDFAAHHELASGYKGLGWRDRWDTINELHLDKVIGQLNEFYAKCRKQGIDVFLAYPALPEDFNQLNRSQLERIETALADGCKIPVLNDIDEMVYENNCFFDTRCHVTYAGKQRRTAQLIERLAPHLDLPQRPIKPDESEQRPPQWAERPGKTQSR